MSGFLQRLRNVSLRDPAQESIPSDPPPSYSVSVSDDTSPSMSSSSPRTTLSFFDSPVSDRISCPDDDNDDKNNNNNNNNNNNLSTKTNPFRAKQEEETVVTHRLAVPSPREPSPAPSVRSATSAVSDSDPYAFLSLFDTVFVIDDSASMVDQRRWQQAREVLKTFAPICTDHDKDGIDVYFLNHRSTEARYSNVPGKGSRGYLGLKNAADIDALFAKIGTPRGGTMTGTRLNGIMSEYLKLLTEHQDDMDAVKPLNIIVITDGKPQDDVEGPIVQAAKKLDKLEAPPNQLGIQFFQVGDDNEAAEALAELDDVVCQAVGARDITDATPLQPGPDGSTPQLTADTIMKTLMGAVHKKWDRKSVWLA